MNYLAIDNNILSGPIHYHDGLQIVSRDTLKAESIRID